MCYIKKKSKGRWGIGNKRKLEKSRNVNNTHRRTTDHLAVISRHTHVQIPTICCDKFPARFVSSSKQHWLTMTRRKKNWIRYENKPSDMLSSVTTPLITYNGPSNMLVHFGVSPEYATYISKSLNIKSCFLVIPQYRLTNIQ